MIVAQKMSMFKLLNPGEEINKGDEYYDYVTDNWRLVSDDHIGRPYQEYVNDHRIIIRRKNPKFYYQHSAWV